MVTPQMFHHPGRNNVCTCLNTSTQQNPQLDHRLVLMVTNRGNYHGNS